MSSDNVELIISDVWGDGLGDQSSVVFLQSINDNSVPILIATNEEKEYQQHSFYIPPNILHYIIFTNVYNLYESVITIRLKNNISVSKIINIDDLIDNNLKLIIMVSDNEIEINKQFFDFNNIDLITLTRPPYQVSINKLYHFYRPQIDFFKIGYVLNRQTIFTNSIENGFNYDTKYTFFGNSLDINDGKLIIGDTGFDNNTTYNSGAFSILRKFGEEWNNYKSSIVRHTTNDESSGFGSTLSMYGDYIITSANSINKAYLYDISDEENTILISTIDETGIYDDLTNYGIVVSMNNSFIAITSPEFKNNGRVFIYNTDDIKNNIFVSDNNYDHSLIKPNDDDIIDNMNFGWQAKLYNNTIMITAYLHNDRGCAYYFVNENNEWIQKQQIIPNDLNIGSNFGISMDYFNNIVCFGSYNDVSDYNDRIFVYKKDENEVWNIINTLNEGTAINNYGYSLSLNQQYIAVSLGTNLET